jgi:hypothetical protein
MRDPVKCSSGYNWEGCKKEYKKLGDGGRGGERVMQLVRGDKMKEMDG